MINIVSAVCAVGVCLGTLALVCILSVYNGFQDLIGGTFSHLDPEIKITLATGKLFDATATEIGQAKQLACVAAATDVIEENAMAAKGDRQTPVTIKGTDTQYDQVVITDSLMQAGAGRFLVGKQGGVEWAVAGLTLAAKLDAGIQVPAPVTIFAPQHDARISLSNPEAAFNQADVYLSGIYCLNQAETDGKYLFTSIEKARRLFGFDSTACTAIELRLQPGIDIAKAEQQIKETVGGSYTVQNKKEQHSDFYHMLMIEKWLTFLILAFILAIAVLNVIGSLSMLIIEKENDIATLRSMGADSLLIRNIFLIEGWLVTATGAAAGIVAGILICLGQQSFGWLKIGSSGDAIYLTNIYPVQLQAGDVAAVLFTVLLLGLVVAWIPTRYLNNKNH